MFCLLQITDSHLFQDTSKRLCGVNPALSFQAVIKHIIDNKKNIDAVLATGDIAQDPVLETYQHFINYTKCLDAPVYCLAGNHDESSQFEQLKGIQQHCQFEAGHYLVKLGNWWVVMLNSALPQAIEGRIEHLDWLDSTLKQAADTSKHVLVTVHHNPVAVGSKWLDAYMVQNAVEFAAVLQCYPNVVKAILHGHTHQLFDGEIAGVPVWGTPSTCFQFLPQFDTYKLDNVASGYRILHLHDDGRIDTEVTRLANPPAGLDIDNTGY